MNDLKKQKELENVLEVKEEIKLITLVLNSVMIGLSLLFLIGFMSTWIYELLDENNIFGDYYSKSREEMVWGARHVWYVVFCVMITIGTIIRIIVISSKIYHNHKYKQLTSK